jgi:uncharacterized protein with NRDE domain
VECKIFDVVGILSLLTRAGLQALVLIDLLFMYNSEERLSFECRNFYKERAKEHRSEFTLRESLLKGKTRMCICFFQVNPPDSPYPFIFCGNRDEYYSRDSISLHEWKDVKHVYGGRDLVRGGAWLGMRAALINSSSSKDSGGFKFAVVHNFRSLDITDPNQPSRGDLPLKFFKGNWTAAQYAEKVANEGFLYKGFTMIVGDKTGIYFTSNRGEHKKLESGIYALSNALIDIPWPKVSHGKEIFRKVIRDHFPKLIRNHEQEDELMLQMRHMVLNDNTLFPHPLPGILDPHTEILLSSVFVEPYKWKDNGFYGTRMQTLCLVRKDGSIRAQEYTLDTSTPAKDWRGTWSKLEVELSRARSSL